MIRVLFVCLGNICRSPTGEGVMRHLVEKEGMGDQVEVDSAGTGAWHIGEYPDSRMTLAARERGYRLDSRGRQLVKQDFKSFDYVIAMDAKNLSSCLSLAPEDATAKITPMNSYIRSQEIDGIPDPYFGGGEGFELVMDLIEEGCENLLTEISDDLKAQEN
jgi:protein-tyrosine phosphatase